MSIVTLVSGGLDSTLVSLLAKEEGLEQFPLFINYNQLNLEKEYAACSNNFRLLGLPAPQKIDISDYGKVIPSGLTDRNLDVCDEAFLPGRNLMFLLLGCAYAFKKDADAVVIGLLNEQYSLFPDQTRIFLDKAEDIMMLAMGRTIEVRSPLIHRNKAEVIEMAKQRGIQGTYSCHAGTEDPCGICIACKEFLLE